MIKITNQGIEAEDKEKNLLELIKLAVIRERFNYSMRLKEIFTRSELELIDDIIYTYGEDLIKKLGIEDTRTDIETKND